MANEDLATKLRRERHVRIALEGVLSRLGEDLPEEVIKEEVQVLGLLEHQVGWLQKELGAVQAHLGCLAQRRVHAEKVLSALQRSNSETSLVAHHLHDLHNAKSCVEQMLKLLKMSHELEQQENDQLEELIGKQEAVSRTVEMFLWDRERALPYPLSILPAGSSFLRVDSGGSETSFFSDGSEASVSVHSGHTTPTPAGDESLAHVERRAGASNAQYGTAKSEKRFLGLNLFDQRMRWPKKVFLGSSAKTAPQPQFSLAPHDNFVERPNQLSEELLRCITALYFRHALPWVTPDAFDSGSPPDGVLWDANSVLSSPATSAESTPSGGSPAHPHMERKRLVSQRSAPSNVLELSKLSLSPPAHSYSTPQRPVPSTASKGVSNGRNGGTLGTIGERSAVLGSTGATPARLYELLSLSTRTAVAHSGPLRLPSDGWVAGAGPLLHRASGGGEPNMTDLLYEGMVPQSTSDGDVTQNNSDEEDNASHGDEDSEDEVVDGGVRQAASGLGHVRQLSLDPRALPDAIASRPRDASLRAGYLAAALDELALMPRTLSAHGPAGNERSLSANWLTGSSGHRGAGAALEGSFEPSGDEQDSGGLLQRSGSLLHAEIFTLHAGTLRSGTMDPFGVLAEHPCADAGEYSHMVQTLSSPKENTQSSSDLSFLGRFTVLAGQLDNVNPGALTGNQKLAFWINVYNAIVLHAYVVRGAPKGASKRLAFLSKVTVNVGGYTFSALSIEHSVLRAHSYRPATLKLPPVAKFRSTDERARWTVMRAEPLVSFALACGALSSPAVRVYTAENIREELDHAKVTYLQATVGISSSNKIILPKILDWYGRDFARSAAELLDWVTKQLPYPQKVAVAERVPTKHKSAAARCMAVAPFDWTFRYILDPACQRLPRLSHTKSHP